MLVELSMEVGAYAGEAKYGGAGAERVIYAVVIERSISVERIFRRSRSAHMLCLHVTLHHVCDVMFMFQFLVTFSTVYVIHFRPFLFTCSSDLFAFINGLLHLHIACTIFPSVVQQIQDEVFFSHLSCWHDFASASAVRYVVSISTTQKSWR